MPKKRFPGLGVRGNARSPDDRVYYGAGSRVEKGKEGVETLTFRRVEVGKMGVEYLEPKLWTILPKVRDLPVAQTARSSRTRR